MKHENFKVITIKNRDFSVACLMINQRTIIPRSISYAQIGVIDNTSSIGLLIIGYDVEVNRHEYDFKEMILPAGDNSCRDIELELENAAVVAGGVICQDIFIDANKNIHVLFLVTAI